MRQSVPQVVAVLGATGATGRHVVTAALARGHKVVALARRRDSLQPAVHLREVVWPDVTDGTTLIGALSGVDVVISALGGADKGPTTVCTDAARAAVPAMAEAGVTRLIAVSAHGVLETHDRSLYSMAVWSGVAEKMKDKETMEPLIVESSLDWTIVRPPMLKDTPATGVYQIGDDLPIRLWHSIGRADLAGFLVREADDPQFVHRYPPDPPVSAAHAPGAGVAVVTGATGGMGRIIAARLAGLGMRVVTVARDPRRADDLRAQIAHHPTGGTLDVIQGDLCTRHGLRAAAEAITATHPAVHLLVNNAGAHYPEHRRSTDGLEMHIAVDYLAAYGLTRQLDQQLRRGRARIVNVASDSLRDTRQVKLIGRPRPASIDRAQLHDLTLLNPADGFVPFEAYARAKLLTLTAGYALARTFAPDGVTLNAVHPGIVATDIIDDLVPRALRPLKPLIRRTMLTPEQGAAATLHLATDPALRDSSGRYYVRDTIAPTPPVSYDLDVQRQLLDSTEQFLDAA